MKHISAKKNDFVKKLRYLHTKKGRDALSLFIVEGPKTVAEALAVSHVEDIAVSETYLSRFSGSGLPGAVVLSDEVFTYVSGTVNTQGILATVSKPENQNEDAEFEIFAEGIQDPGNLGTLLRTAESFGAGKFVLTRECADPYSLKSVRSSTGSILRMPVSYIDDMPGSINEMKSKGYKVFGGHLKGEDISVLSTQKYSRVILVIGSESRGMSIGTQEMCDLLLKIPMYGKNESLNASVAAGILMYEMKKHLI